MFKPKQKNRKRRSGQIRKSRDSVAYSVSDLPEDEFLLQADIGSLEDLLADLESTPPPRKSQQSRQDILPPPEPRLAHHNPVISRRKTESNRKGLAQFIILVVIALTLIFWLFYTGG